MLRTLCPFYYVILTVTQYERERVWDCPWSHGKQGVEPRLLPVLSGARALDLNLDLDLRDAGGHTREFV